MRRVWATGMDRSTTSGIWDNNRMFTPDTYRARRNRLKKDVGSGLLLFLGNEEVFILNSSSRVKVR